MPRPKKCRRVCRLPKNRCFFPERDSGETVVLTVEEFETLRLIDKEAFSQEECAAAMGVARTTVQQICASARKKVAIALTDGLRIRVEGGEYRLCEGNSACRCGAKMMLRCQQKPQGDDIMKIAVTYENGTIFQHFGHTEQFKIYDVRDNKIVASQVADTCGSGHGALAGFLAERGVEVLICGGIGGGAQVALAEAGIRVYGGVSGDADKAVESLLAGALSYDPDVRCSHHEHEHGEGNCGSHAGKEGGCGSRGCGHGCH